MTDFVGAKAALFCGETVLVYLRDTTAGLPWAGLWDLPGGGREGSESAEACVLREIYEEFGLILGAERLVYRQSLPSMTDPEQASWLFGGWLEEAEIAAIRFGDEGQRWEMTPVAAFIAHHGAIPEMRRRVAMAWGALDHGAPLRCTLVSPASALPISA